MKISTKKNSRFVQREDIPQPMIVTIDDVTEDRTIRNKDILHFDGAILKPFPLNWTNRVILVAAFGEESDAWHGRQIEIYFDPSIPNPRDPDRPGGIKIRVPRPKPPVPPHNGNGNGKPAQPPQPSLADRFIRASNGLKACTTVENLHKWLAWAQKIHFSPTQAAALEELCDECTRQLTGAPDDSEIPF